MNLKEELIKKVLEIEGSYKFKTLEKDLIGFWFGGVEGEALSLILKDSDIEATTESPCLKEYNKNDELTREQAHSSLVVKWKKDFTEKDVKNIFDSIKKGVETLRNISGWKR